MAAIYCHFTAKPIHLELRGRDRGVFLTLNWHLSHRMAIKCAFKGSWVSDPFGPDMISARSLLAELSLSPHGRLKSKLVLQILNRELIYFGLCLRKSE